MFYDSIDIVGGVASTVARLNQDKSPKKQFLFHSNHGFTFKIELLILYLISAICAYICFTLSRLNFNFVQVTMSIKIYLILLNIEHFEIQIGKTQN